MERVQSFTRFLQRATGAGFTLAGLFVDGSVAYATFTTTIDGWVKAGLQFRQDDHQTVTVHFLGTDTNGKGHHTPRLTRFTTLLELYEAIDNDLETTYKELILDGVFCFAKL